MDLTYLFNQLQKAQNPVFNALSVGRIITSLNGTCTVRDYNGAMLNVSGVGEKDDVATFANGKIVENFGNVEINQITLEL